MMKAVRHMKIFAQVAGNKMQRRRNQEKIKWEVEAEVYKKKA